MWYRIDENYLNHLKEEGDERIPDQDYGIDSYKPFFKLFTIKDMTYVTQINHFRKRHLHIREDLDFTKLKDNTGKILGVVNLNYMFPVLEKHLTKMEQKDIEATVSQKWSDEKVQSYMNMLEIEKQQIYDRNIHEKAVLLYNEKQLNRLDPFMNKRVLDYTHLENKCVEYELHQHFDKEEISVSSSMGLIFADVDDERYTIKYDDINRLHLIKEVHEIALELDKDKSIEIDISKDGGKLL
ncbi:type III toxin-antitoxin system ToxN/AbiQ family toxin [Erysipelothrix aquatica]|uniref:type III toxin-antitoxin system ToxN/AbiQ family toxin n=1 Tax=Erysipelothrix aquatica TaxID=2683714 RepID=UPI0013572A34|nr:type III toxin-antitoxin system ToxN/AbiQ family toxin [Erysipelothrix aquatica]